jgi:cytidine deaminase
MHKKEINISVEEFDGMHELAAPDRQLVELAEASLKDAYAAYSHYRVGAALRLTNGKIFTGNNQENAAYPSGLCAERVAMFYAKSQYPDESIESVAIAAKADDFTISEAVAPCGSCRQVMAEYQNQQDKPIRVIMKGEKGPIVTVGSVGSLLPLMFHAEELKRKK